MTEYLKDATVRLLLIWVIREDHNFRGLYHRLAELCSKSIEQHELSFLKAKPHLRIIQGNAGGFGNCQWLGRLSPCQRQVLAVFELLAKSPSIYAAANNTTIQGCFFQNPNGGKFLTLLNIGSLLPMLFGYRGSKQVELGVPSMPFV